VPGKYSQASLQLLHPSAEDLNGTRRDRVKRVSSWIHPHSHGRTQEHLKKGEKGRSVTRLTSVESPIKRDAVYLNKNRKWVTKKYWQNNKPGKVENEALGIPKLLIDGRIKGLHVIHCIDAGNEALRYLVGHRSIIIEEIITLAMILRLLLMTCEHLHKLNLHIVWLW
jgi:hypothetical protein